MTLNSIQIFHNVSLIWKVCRKMCHRKRVSQHGIDPWNWNGRPVSTGDNITALIRDSLGRNMGSLYYRLSTRPVMTKQSRNTETLEISTPHLLEICTSYFSLRSFWVHICRDLHYWDLTTHCNLISMFGIRIFWRNQIFNNAWEETDLLNINTGTPFIF